jgi:hypothetical protein
MHLEWLKERKVVVVIAVGLLVILPATILAAYLLKGQLSEKVPTIKSANLLIKDYKGAKVFALRQGQQHTKYVSQTYRTNFQFDAIVPHWQESNADDQNRTVSIRVSEDSRHWSSWTPIEVMAPQQDAPYDTRYGGQIFPEAPIITIGSYFQYKVDLTRTNSQSPTIRNLTVSYIDSRTPPIQKMLSGIASWFRPTKVAAESSTPNVISRAQWGSPNPTGSANRGTDAYWAPTYQPVTQVFIHHTVDSDYESLIDGPSVVRAIYQYQAITLGWGDIGYNYLVDEAGNVYEGRAGGDNVTGGHVYNYNHGSMGIALIGCFQTNNASCNSLTNNNVTPPSGAMTNSLTDLLAWKTTQYGIDPEAQHSFCQQDGTGCLSLYTIAGHRDAYPTACPGDLTYNELQSIRDTTASKKAANYYYAAEQLNYPTVNLGDNNQLSVTLQFKNVGTITWRNSGLNPINLGTANPSDHASVFQGSGWLSSDRPATLNEASVPPGSVGSFTFTIANPSGYTGDWYEYFRLVAEGNTDFGDYFGLHIITRDYSYSLSSEAAYTDSTKTATANLGNASPGETAWITVGLKNTGNTTWYNSGPFPVDLGTTHYTDRPSTFYDTSSWLGRNRPARLTEASVAPGQTGTFAATFLTPARGGSYQEYFTPVTEGITWMSDVGLFLPATVNATYDWQFMGQAAYTDTSESTPVDLSNLSSGQRFYFDVTARNTGSSTWYANGPYPLHLGTSNPLDSNSVVHDPSWLYATRPTAVSTTVAPAQTGHFAAYYTAPGQSGTYKAYFRPVAEGVTWLPDIGLYIPVTVR